MLRRLQDRLAREYAHAMRAWAGQVCARAGCQKDRLPGESYCSEWCAQEDGWDQAFA